MTVMVIKRKNKSIYCLTIYLITGIFTVYEDQQGERVEPYITYWTER